MKPVQVAYDSDITLDAYSVYYLSRNTLIPAIAIRDLAYHPAFQILPTHVKVLDLGSGTGAVTLGTLWLAGRARTLGAFSVEVVSVDTCQRALDRQERIVRAMGYPDQVDFICGDLSRVDECVQRAATHGPYDYIFVANCLTEMTSECVLRLLAGLAGLVTKNGVLVVAEAQRDYVKRLISTMACNAAACGWHVYYPCSESQCSSGESCWVWREHQYRFPPMKVGGITVDSPRDDLIISWLILTRQACSLYQVFRQSGSPVEWGPISKAYHTKSQYAACIGGKPRTFSPNAITGNLPQRGAVIGLDGDNIPVGYRGM